MGFNGSSLTTQECSINRPLWGSPYDGRPDTCRIKYMQTDNNTAVLAQEPFKAIFVRSPNQDFSIHKFDNFESVLQLAAEYGIAHQFTEIPVLPEYPSECLEFFNDTRRCSIDFMTPRMAAIDTLKVTKKDVVEVYETSLRLNGECGNVKILDQKLIADLMNNKPIYLFFKQGFLKACSEQEAQGFIKLHKALAKYLKSVHDFSNLQYDIKEAKLKAQTVEQAKAIDLALGVKWRGVFAIQWRMLHENNYLGTQKKTTVAHVRLLDDYQNGRLKRSSGQTLCGAKSKFGYSDDMNDLDSYLITCPKCLAMTGLA